MDERLERWKQLGQLASGISLPPGRYGMPEAIPGLREALRRRKRGRTRLLRNERIAELVAHGTKRRKIAQTLKSEGYEVPRGWKAEGIRDFVEAYNDAHYRQLFFKMCSAQKPIKIPRSLRQPFRR